MESMGQLVNKFWQGVKKSAQSVLNGTPWMSAGIVLNPYVYETYPSTTPRLKSAPCGDLFYKQLGPTQFTEQDWEDITFEKKKKEDEINLLIDLLSHPAGFDVDLAGVLCIRPVDECSPPVRWEVDWETDLSKPGDYQHQEFEDLLSAAVFFVNKRHELEYGLDFEAIYYKQKNQ